MSQPSAGVHTVAAGAAGAAAAMAACEEGLARDSACSNSSGPVRGEAACESRLPAYELVDFAQLEGTACPCGWARRAFTEVADFPGTIHVTEISEDARLHYHRRLTETYYFLECGPAARMQLNEESIPVHPGMCLLIRPGTRHRALGRMKVLIVVFPKFDPQDEWFDPEKGDPSLD